MTPPLRPGRTLVGSTVLQAVPALQDDAPGRAVLDIAVALLRAGARSLVAGGGGALVGELQAQGGEWMALDVAMARRWRRRRAFDAFARLLAAERVDLVHAHGADAAACALPAARAARAALVTASVGAPPPPGWGRPPGDAQARGDAVLACSAFAAQAIAERHQVPPERIVVVPRRVDTGWFDPAAVAPERVAAVRQSWRVRPGARIVFAPGPIAPAQGGLVLVDAARSLVNGGLRGVVFVLAGAQAEEGYAAALDARIAAQGLAGVVRRVGRCPDMPAAYAACDLVALPAEQAGIFNAMAAEAQAMARPVIASALGALPELILAPAEDAARTGWLAPPHDALALARVLAAALALGPRALEEIGLRGRAFAEETFSPERVAGATLEVYRLLLAGEAG